MASKEELNKQEIKEIKEEKQERVSPELDKLFQSIRFDVGSSESETRRYFLEKLITEYPFGAQVKMDEFDIPTSSGEVEYKIGFKPKVLICLFSAGSAPPSGSQYISIGFTNGESTFVLEKGGSSVWYSKVDGTIMQDLNGGVDASIDSFLLNGFTLDWSAVGTGNAFYVAIG